jgi:hypothetical protein
MRELAVRVIVQSIAAQNTLLRKNAETGGREYEAVTLGTGLSWVGSALTLGIIDTGADHYMRMALGENLTADRTLTWLIGDAARQITLSGNPTLADWFDQSVKVAATVRHALLGIGAAVGADEGLFVNSGQTGWPYTAAKFGYVAPLYLGLYDPWVGFDIYMKNGGWVYGAGSTGWYGARITHTHDTGIFSITTTAVGGNADAAAVLIDRMVISPAGVVEFSSGDVYITPNGHGLVLIDDAAPAHKWRVGVEADGTLTTTDLGVA